MRSRDLLAEIVGKDGPQPPPPPERGQQESPLKEKKASLTEVEASLKKLLQETSSVISQDVPSSRKSKAKSHVCPPIKPEESKYDCFGESDKFKRNEARISDLRDEDKAKMAKLLQSIVKLTEENEALHGKCDALQGRTHQLEAEKMDLLEKESDLRKKFAQSLQMLQTYQEKVSEMEQELQVRENEIDQGHRSDELRQLREEIIRLRTVVIEQAEARKKKKRHDGAVTSSKLAPSQHVETQVQANLVDDLRAKVANSSHVQQIPRLQIEDTGKEFGVKNGRKIRTIDEELLNGQDVQKMEQEEDSLFESFLNQQREKKIEKNSDAAWSQDESELFENAENDMIRADVFENTRFEASLFDLIEELEESL